MDDIIVKNDREDYLEYNLKKDIIELHELCLELGQYVKEQDEKINETVQNNQQIGSIMLEGKENIDYINESINSNRKNILWSIGIGTVVGLIATGSIIIAPIAGITTGVIGYKILK